MSLPSSLIFLLQLPPSSRKMDNFVLHLYTCPAVLVQRDRRMDRHDFSAVSPLSTVNTHYSCRHLHLGSSDAMSSSWRAGSETRKRNEMKQTHCLGSWCHLLNVRLFWTDWLLVNRQAAGDKMSTRGLVIRDCSWWYIDKAHKLSSQHGCPSERLPGQALIDANFAVPNMESKFDWLAWPR